MFSGVYWDIPDILPDNIDRIEVISGPGATLWGANAVNGVINVITRDTVEVAGAYADVRAGPERQAIGVRYSGAASDDLTYSAHGRFLREASDFTAAGQNAHDGWHRLGGGFRADWRPSAIDLLTLQGEAFGGQVSHEGPMNEDFSGRNLSLRWQRKLPGSELQAQLFYDRIARDERVTGGAKFRTDTFDGELQQSFKLGGRHAVVWGAGARLIDYDIVGSASLFFAPAKDHLFIADLFVQDRYALSSELTLIAGLKAESLPHAGTSVLPELRIAWKPNTSALIWASASRALRSPTPFDTDVQERVGIISVSGNPAFLPERLTALELGTRLQPSSSFSLSATLFYHHYDNLRSVELIDGPGLFALGWGNNIRGSTYGIDAWADWGPTHWWTLAIGGTLLAQDFKAEPSSSNILGIEQIGTDPPYWLSLRSTMKPLPGLSLDLDLRAVGALRYSAVQAYRELNGKLEWTATPELALSVTGTNLLHDRHQEYPGADLIPRRVMAGVEVRF